MVKFRYTFDIRHSQVTFQIYFQHKTDFTFCQHQFKIIDYLFKVVRGEDRKVIDDICKAISQAVHIDKDANIVLSNPSLLYSRRQE